jgi:hypothetical protein
MVAQKSKVNPSTGSALDVAASLRLGNSLSFSRTPHSNSISQLAR